ncbi:hypothetical protein [Gorillibacterium sp. CAU 1737]|uniref:hypothetical protein n=1 Tax=Gorillibacterium sp. CAU 1737 TaxID=3140362 RepID=UPI0032609AE3
MKYPRYTSYEARLGLERLIVFSDIANQIGADWEYVAADENRLDEFLRVYEQEELTVDEKFTLMIIIVSSYEEWLRMKKTDKEKDEWPRIVAHLEHEYKIHRNTVKYWSVLEESDLEDVYRVTPQMREIEARFRAVPRRKSR